MSKNNPLEWLEFQNRIIHTLEVMTSDKKLPVVLSEVLGISQNAAYKKIKGMSQFSLPDIISICNHFKISFDQYFDLKTSPLQFYGDALRKKPEKYSDYFLNLSKYLKRISNLKEVKCTYLANEIRIFHYMLHPALFHFKLFAWNYTSWQIPNISKKFNAIDFESDHLLNESINYCYNTYYAFDGTEVWNIRMFDITLDQLMYFIQLRAFESKYDVIKILDSLFDLLEHLSQLGDRAIKTTNDANKNKSNITILANELVTAVDTVLIDSPEAQMVFMTYDTPNLIRTSDHRMFKYTKEWLENTIKHSTIISGKGERERESLIQTFQKKLIQGKKEIEGLLAYKY